MNGSSSLSLSRPSSLSSSLSKMAMSTVQNKRDVISLQEIFRQHDKSGRGVVSSWEIGLLLRSAGLNPTEQTCSRLIGMCEGRADRHAG